MSRFGYKSGGTRSLRSVTILFNISTLPSILSKNPNFVNMFKLVVIACALAVASAAPQLLFRSAVIDNEGAKQVGLPYANGWTDGPNNGVGGVPVVHSVAHTYAAAPIVHHSPVVHSSVVHAGVVGAHPFIL